MPAIGIVALQGAAGPHQAALVRLGAEVRTVRLPGDLDGLDGIVLPGGESTTLSMLLDSSGLRDPLGAALRAGLPVLATCAGLILLADEVLDGRDDQRSLSVLDVAVRRNAYGRQVDSFEADLRVAGLDDPFPAVFIRAPIVERCGPDVEVRASFDGAPVLVGAGPVLAASFHPELSGDDRVHALWLRGVTAA